jgi:DNA uptake protein ComE-like DNA-binding protein
MRFNRSIALCCSILLSISLSAQPESPATRGLLENDTSASDPSVESSAQQYGEDLEYLSDHPLDLNTATRQDLQDLHLLHDLQIDQLLNYRDQYGPFLNIYELQAVPGLDLPDIRSLLHYTSIKAGPDTRYTPLLKGLCTGATMN